MLHMLRNFFIKIFLKLFFKRRHTVESGRAREKFFAKWMAKPSAGISVKRFDVDGLPLAWISPETDSQTVILYLHGGGYVSGSLVTHQMLCADLACSAEARVLFVEYRLAPEHPFPAALDDTRKAYHWLLAQGVAPENIFVAGDSAGGGLSLALTLSLQDAGEPLPVGVVSISPWTDLTMSSVSHREKARAEMTLHPDNLRMWAFCYAGEGDLQNPLISPYFAEYAGFPPLLIQVGSEEVLLDDARVIAEKAEAAGVNVTLSVCEGMWHVWQTLGRLLPEAHEAFDEIGRFVHSILNDNSLARQVSPTGDNNSVSRDLENGNRLNIEQSPSSDFQISNNEYSLGTSQGTRGYSTTKLQN